MVQIINSHQSWPGLQQTPLGKHQSEIANHRLGKPDMLSQHSNAKCRQSIPACIAKVIVYRGLKEPRTVDKLWGSEEPDMED